MRHVIMDEERQGAPQQPGRVLSTSSSTFHVTRQLYVRSNVRVYLCENSATGNMVVIKHVRHATTPSIHRIAIPGHPTSRLQLDMTSDSIDQERTIARLLDKTHHGEHRNILRYLNVEIRPNETHPTRPDDVFLAMEYCARGDLFTLLEQQPTQRFDERTALFFFDQIVDGVIFLHERLGIAHRDLSLENVLVDQHWCAKICDFGVSTRVGRRCHETVGKLYYMAPEVVAGSAYDPIRADLWSLGMMLFILLTGSPLFQVATPSDTAWEALERVGVRGILRQWGLDGEISERSIGMLTRLLQRDPTRRPQSALCLLGARNLV